VAFSTHMQDLAGQVFAMFVLTVAAAEAAVGLAILVVYHRNRGSIEVEDIEAGAFKESGTGVASKLVVIDKPEGCDSYEQRVRAVEAEGATRSDAQAVVDAEEYPREAPGFEISEQPSLF